MTRPTVRRNVIVAAVVVVVLAAIVIGFYRIGRATVTPPQATTSPATSQPTDPSPSPTYAPTDQYGSPEPGLPQGTATAGQGGTAAGPDGLPLGYSHDQTGAVNAATNYLTWMNSLIITNKDTADAMASSAAADPASRTALISSFDQLRTGMADLTADRPEPARGAYAVATYSDTEAMVYIWAPEVTTDRKGQTDHLWAIDAIDLVWSANDWKLRETLIAKTGAAAVDPTDAGGNPTAAEKHSILARTPSDPGEISDSAAQSWFEYSNAPH